MCMGFKCDIIKILKHLKLNGLNRRDDIPTYKVLETSILIVLLMKIPNKDRLNFTVTKLMHYFIIALKPQHEMFLYEDSNIITITGPRNNS